jgi:exodeoxyribonuclease VII small subunit
MSDKPVSEMTFEEAMEALDSVVKDLETGNVPLEKSIQLYERGAELKARCEAKLKEAEEKIAQITLSPDGEPTGKTPVEGM